MVQLWRINLKTQSLNQIDSAEFCVKNNIVGIGWQVNSVPQSKEDYKTKWRQENPPSQGWSKASNAILHRMNVDDMVWSRNRKGVYYLGKILSDWRYEGGTNNVEADVVNVRDCRWVKIGAMDNVPGKILNCFRPAATVQQVNDTTALLYSEFLFRQLNGQLSGTSTGVISHDLFSFLAPDDFEDILAIYLQVNKQCILFPSTCKTDTMNVECIFKTLTDGVRVGMQVKSGRAVINQDDYAEFDGTMYLFSASGSYIGNSWPNCICLDPDTLRSFAVENRQIMPARVQRWIDFAHQTGS